MGLSLCEAPTHKKHTKNSHRKETLKQTSLQKNSETEVLGKIVHFGSIKAGRMTYNLYSNNRVVGYFKGQICSQTNAAQFKVAKVV